MNTYQELKTVSLDEFSAIMRPQQLEEYTLDTPAMSVVTDFRKTQPLMMEQDVSLDEAIHMMRKVHVRSVLVIDAEEQFRGLLTVADLESRKALSVATSSGLNRSDLTIKDVMTPRERLRGVPLSDVEHGHIGDLLKTLQHEGSQHMLVVDADSRQLRGVISASDIARRLKISVDISQRATSFREVVDMLVSGRET
ncbi:CBS domain-containing protein [Marinobacterium arenosum]|uniref:CBS domain-containing protein n=1 Tax=Marinobacterium arenosum TaxID=2862496 RepID=UPI001C9642BB|nr:CBS domain-containing protein [Marinobacterium arenosum]MBY4677504.1 CBS domain-containing protein [Marinobacterium arenosum]